MKTTIKIHDAQWFKEHCKVIGSTEYGSSLEPKYHFWRHVFTLNWSLEGIMSQLVGQVLEVEHDSGIAFGSMNNARYFAGGFWIPNWTIEWVKETE